MDGTRGQREPRAIRNRDVIALSRMTHVIQAVECTEHMRQQQQDRLWNITQQITGMPGGQGTPSGLETYFAAISEAEAQYKEALEAYVDALKAANAILNGIDSLTLRVFVTMRYVIGMSRKRICTRLHLSRWAYSDLCERIEQAEDMDHVVWVERFVLRD